MRLDRQADEQLLSFEAQRGLAPAHELIPGMGAVERTPIDHLDDACDVAPKLGDAHRLDGVVDLPGSDRYACPRQDRAEALPLFCLDCRQRPHACQRGLACQNPIVQ